MLNLVNPSDYPKKEKHDIRNYYARGIHEEEKFVSKSHDGKPQIAFKGTGGQG